MARKINEALKENLALMEHALEKCLSRTDSQYGMLYDAMRYGVLGGGKRIRPFLTLEFSRAYGGSDDAAIPFACAIELIHSYSLIHDDLPCMDNDEYRRGRLTCHRKFGEANALLAGDALLTYAFETAATNKAVSVGQIAQAVKLLSECAGAAGMVGGQQLDMLGEGGGFDLDTLIRMNRLKTGRLIKCACLLGCVAAGKGEAEISAAERYADGVGLAFQVIDDIMDEGTEDDKTTFLTFMKRDEAYAYAKRLTDDAVEGLDCEILRELAYYLLERKQ